MLKNLSYEEKQKRLKEFTPEQKKAYQRSLQALEANQESMLMFSTMTPAFPRVDARANLRDNPRDISASEEMKTSSTKARPRSL